jgi:MFS family permease
VRLGTFMLLLDIMIVNVALPEIQWALHSSFSDLHWVVDAYALTLAAFLLTAGSLADMHGRRVLHLIGLVVVHRRVGAVRLRHQHADAPAVSWLAGGRRSDHVRGVARPAG